MFVHRNLYRVVFHAGQVGAEHTHVIGSGMTLFPLHQDELGDDERDDEDEHHLSVHGFMPFVFGVHPGMFQPVEQMNKETFRIRLQY